NVNYLEICEKKRQAEIDANNYGIRKIGKRMDALDQDLSHEMEKRLETLGANYALVLSDRDRWEKAFYNLQVWVSERLGWGAMDARPDDVVDGLATFGESQPPKPQGPPSGSQ
ncbi:hypothetical protein Tco_0112836, partial [Tanacetum coccineum]